MLLSLTGCGRSGSGKLCSAPEGATRPPVQLTWEIAHTNMDDDPPRPKVTLVLKAGPEKRVEIGDITGVCKLVELGKPPETPGEGVGVTELVCAHGDSSSFARVVFAKEGALVVRRYEKDATGESMKNIRDLETLEIPACPLFTAELAQTAGL